MFMSVGPVSLLIIFEEAESSASWLSVFPSLYQSVDGPRPVLLNGRDRSRVSFHP